MIQRIVINALLGKYDYDLAYAEIEKLGKNKEIIERIIDAYKKSQFSFFCLLAFERVIFYTEEGYCEFVQEEKNLKIVQDTNKNMVWKNILKK
jgi:hypothetical protein